MARAPKGPTRPTLRTANPPSSQGGGGALGIVMRFNPEAAGSGIRQLEAGGLRIASSRDFRSAGSVPNDFAGADVQYFERFGIAIVRGAQDRLQPVLTRTMADRTVDAARDEQVYHALGMPAASGADDATHDTAGSGPASHDPSYLRGYRDGVTQLIDRLLAGTEAGEAQAAARFDESSVTWGLEAIGIANCRLSGAGMKLAVLDTGFDETHPDFRGRDVTKKLFASRSTPGDVVGHGTHCIGTACGPLHPGSGPRYGIAHEAAIFAGKVLGDDGRGTDRSIIAGIDWALDRGCQIISMSLGAPTRIGSRPTDDYERIGQVCLNSGTLIVAAAGNESQRPAFIASIDSPANASTIMAVAAVDRNMRVASFSCGGLNPGQNVDIAAPGVDVLSTLPGGGHARWDGTSMATPHVAGVAALIAQSDASFRGGALWARIIQLAKRLRSPERDVGRGLLQAPRA